MVGRCHFEECGTVRTALLSSFQDETSNIERDPVVLLALNYRLMALVRPRHRKMPQDA